MSMHGAEVDILSGRPLGSGDDSPAPESNLAGGRQAVTLRRQAHFLAVAGSAEAQQLVDDVSEVLMGRIGEFLTTDPAGQAMVSILARLGAKKGIARAAVTRLQREFGVID